MKNESVVSRIISAIKGAKVAVRENLFYDTPKSLIDFADDDLINKRALSGAGVIIPPDPVDIVAGLTTTPLIIAYNTTVSPSYTLIRGSDNTYDWARVAYDGSRFTITGDDDGTGHWIDDYTFSIKP